MEEHPLKVAREQRGWSQARLAEELEVSVRTVVRWEQGQTLPYPIYREQLCRLFSANAQDLGLLASWDEIEVEQQKVTAQEVREERVVITDPLLPEALGHPRRLLGRTELLKQIKDRLLTRGKQRAIIALQGLPGVGKTALAVAIATDPQVQEQFSDGVLWAGLGPQASVIGVLTRWGSLLGVKASDVANPAEERDWASAVSAVIGQRRFLLMIDDGWSGEEALALQVGGPFCAHLLTTRIPMVGYTFAQEATVVVPELSEQDGLALLTRLVPSVVEQEPEEARALVQAVGGLPLALNLLGRYLATQVYTRQPRRVQSALERLRVGEQRLRVSMAVPPGEHPAGLAGTGSFSLQATIALNVQLLSEETQHALAALALFPARPNSFSEEAAVAVADAPVEQLDRLWDAGLLESSGVGRYALHQTIVDYARLQPLDTAAQQRLISHMVEYVQTHEQDFGALELETKNVLAALDGALEQGEYQKLLQGIVAFIAFMRTYGLYPQARRYLQAALEMARARGDREHEARLLTYLVSLAEPLGIYEQADQDGQQALVLAHELALPSVECDLLTVLGTVASRRGGNQRASAYLEQGLVLARQLADDARISLLLGQYSRIIALLGDYDRAEQLCREGIALAESRGDQELLSRLFSTWGVIFGRKGQWVQASEKSQQSLMYARQSGHREIVVTALANLGSMSGNQGNLVQAEAFFKEGLEIARQIGHRAQISTLLTNLGTMAGRNEDYVQAEQYYQEALNLVQQIGRQETLPLLFSNLGAAIGLQGDYERANQYFARAVELARQRNALWELSGVLGEWGEHHLHHRQLEPAAAVFQEIIALNEPTVHNPRTLLGARLGRAKVMALRGNIAEARHLGMEVFDAFVAAGDYRAGEVQKWIDTLPAEERTHPQIDV